MFKPKEYAFIIKTKTYKKLLKIKNMFFENRTIINQGTAYLVKDTLQSFCNINLIKAENICLGNTKTVYIVNNIMRSCEYSTYHTYYHNGIRRAYQRENTGECESYSYTLSSKIQKRILRLLKGDI